MIRRRRRRTPAQQRARRARRRRIVRGVEAVFCLGVISAFAYFFIRYAQGSTDFTVRHVAIHGLHHLGEDAVFQQSGIARDGNVFSFDVTAVKDRVERLPYVARCDVNLLYPDTVALNVTEREPVASLMVQRRAFAIDREGVVLREYGPLEMPIEPFITGVDGVNFVRPGDKLDEPAVQSALQLWEAFRASPISRELSVSELAALHRDDIRMYCNEVPYEIRWGREDFTRAVARLYVLWTEMDGAMGCQAYLDLRFGADVPCK